MGRDFLLFGWLHSLFLFINLKNWELVLVRIKMLCYSVFSKCRLTLFFCVMCLCAKYMHRYQFAYIYTLNTSKVR